MIKKIIKSIGMVLILIFLVINACSCDFTVESDEELISHRVNEFIAAYNSGDIDAAIECFDAKSRNTYGAAIKVGEGILGGITGIDISAADIFALVVGTSNDDLLSVEMNKIQIIDETSAIVVLTATYSDSRFDMDETVEDITLQMIKENNDWFINAQIDWEKLIESLG